MQEQASKTVIKVDDLVQKSKKAKVLDGISFSLSRGESLGVFGLRGAGKTALLHILAGVERFSSGKVEVLGCDIHKSKKFKNYIGLVTQEPSLFNDLTAGENLDFLATLKNADKRNISGLVERLELEDCLEDAVSSMDAGGYQRLCLACAMISSPQLLILDEIIKDIDLYSRRLIVREIKSFLRDGGTCICAFSNIDSCKYVDKLAWLEDGQITSYDPVDAVDRWNSLIDAVEEQSGEKNE